MLVARPTTPQPKNQTQAGMPLAPFTVPVCIITLVTMSRPTADRAVVTQ